MLKLQSYRGGYMALELQQDRFDIGRWQPCCLRSS